MCAKNLKMKNRVLLLLLALVIVPFACTAPATEPDNQEPENQNPGKTDDPDPDSGSSIKVESLVVTPGQVELKEGETLQLEAVLLPEGAEGKVIWKTLEPNTTEKGEVTVSETGLVTAVKAGAAEVEARCGEASDICYITVSAEVVPVESIELSLSEIVIEAGSDITIEATIFPEEARAFNPVSFVSDNTEVATVDDNGKVTGISAGETFITVTAGDKSVKCPVTVNPVAPSLSVTFTDISASNITFSSVTLNGKFEVQGCSDRYVGAVFYYIESNGNPSAEEIRTNGKTAVSESFFIPGSVDYSKPVSSLAVNTRYCCVASLQLEESYFYSDVLEFTTADLPEIPEVVDMGLSVNWRGWNVGATKPEGSGSFYAWGETGTKEDYVWETYKFRKAYNTMTKYVTNASDGYNNQVDNKVVLESQDDAATQFLGSNWRTPTWEEMQELKDNVVMKWTRYKDVLGIVMTSKINDAVLFLPAAGYCYGSSGQPVSVGNYGQYWTSTLYGDNNKKAYNLVIKSKVYEINVGPADRYMGYTIRPVTPKAN